jgi:transposase
MLQRRARWRDCPHDYGPYTTIYNVCPHRRQRYGGESFRAEIIDRGAKPVIPNESNRVTLHSFSKRAYRGSRIE